VNVTWTLTNTTGGVVSGDLSTSGPEASTRFTGNKVGTTQILATVAGVPARTPSGVLSVVPGVATQLQVRVPVPVSYAAGITKTLAITALDAFANVAIGYDGVKVITFTGASPSTRPVT